MKVWTGKDKVCKNDSLLTCGITMKLCDALSMDNTEESTEWQMCGDKKKVGNGIINSVDDLVKEALKRS